MAAGKASLLELTAGAARLVALPSRGGALAGLWLGARPVLRPMAGDDPFGVANIVLAPFSNRVSRAFDWQGAQIELPCNLSGEPFPIHGDAFQREWIVTMQSGSHAVLELANGSFGPLAYCARQTITLAPDRLDLSLSLTSMSDIALPFGLGFHPWFPRSRATTLQFTAGAVWQEDARHLPVTPEPTPIPAHWDFKQARPLPDGWVNNGFADWTGELRIDQGPDAVSVTLRASPVLRTLILYSPDAGTDFFCAEPVSHPVDAFNLPGMPDIHVLSPGESLSASMHLHWGP